MQKVCYFTSKDKNDIRVFHKECISLVKNGYDVTMVCPNTEDKVVQGVKILGVAYPYKSVLDRFTKLPCLLYKKALSVDADIYHFNDPASLKYAMKLKRKGKKIVFDAFEDHPSMWMNRGSGIKGLLFKVIGILYKQYEMYACRHFDAVLVCYHWTKDRLLKVNKNIELVLNFPIVENSSIKGRPIRLDKRVSICYAGTISDDWNIPTVIDAVNNVESASFNLAGWCGEELMSRMESKEGWGKVHFFGKLSKDEVYNKIYDKSDIGVALYHYSPLCHGKVGNMSNNKLFEYMQMGLPVICTDFDLWKDVIEKNSCGICVAPDNAEAIAEAIIYIQNHPEEAHQMGVNGQRVVLEKYNWGTQESILLNLYNRLS